MFIREKGVAIAWLMLFAFLAGAAVYDRLLKPSAVIDRMSDSEQTILRSAATVPVER